MEVQAFCERPRRLQRTWAADEALLRHPEGQPPCEQQQLAVAWHDTQRAVKLHPTMQLRGLNAASVYYRPDVHRCQRELGKPDRDFLSKHVQHAGQVRVPGAADQSSCGKVQTVWACRHSYLKFPEVVKWVCASKFSSHVMARIQRQRVMDFGRQWCIWG